MDTTLNLDYERVLMNIVRVLPPDRAEQLVDFARFLEGQILDEEILQDTDMKESAADDARWGDLFDSDAGQATLEKLADEALAEYRAGRTKRIVFDDEGRIGPE